MRSSDPSDCHDSQDGFDESFCSGNSLPTSPPKALGIEGPEECLWR